MTTFLKYYDFDDYIEITSIFTRINNEAKKNNLKIVQHQVIFDYGISVLFETIE